MDRFEEFLSAGIAKMNLHSTAGQRGQLLDFLRLLRKWNRVYNLTAISSLEQMVLFHLLDSLVLLPYLSGERVLDVGTGAGLPGLPLAVLSPEREFTLLDGNAKKTRFVQQAVIELGLANVRVETARIEKFESPRGFDCILTRAFASLGCIVAQTSRMLNRDGLILAQKGKLPANEIDELANAVVEVFPLSIPGIDAERHLVTIKILG